MITRAVHIATGMPLRGDSKRRGDGKIESCDEEEVSFVVTRSTRRVVPPTKADFREKFSGEYRERVVSSLLIPSNRRAALSAPGAILFFAHILRERF